MDDLGVSATALDRAKAISGILREEALAGEKLGRLTDRAADAILASNLCSMMVPPGAGGLGASRIAFFEAAEEIARADGSAGWCVGLCNGINFGIHHAASPELHEEVFGGGPVSCWASLAPKGAAEPVSGGFRLKGHYGFGSGSAMSQWTMVATPLPDRDGFQWFRGYVVPKTDVRMIEGSWDVMGLRATHSVDYEIDAFVPAHRTIEYPMMAQGDPGGFYGNEIVELGQMGMVAFASGVAQAALAELIAVAPKTKRMAADVPQAEDHSVQFGIGELEGRLRAARTWYLALVAEFDAAAEAGRAPPGSLTLFQAAQTLTRAARETALFAFDSAGTGVVYASDPLQRALRDLLAGLKHVQLSPAILGRIGKLRLGVGFAAPRI